MTRELQLVMVPPAVPAPRGALWAADGFVQASGLVRRLVVRQPVSRAEAPPGTYRRTTPTLFALVRHKVWRALAAHGHRRAAGELRRQAQRWESIDPKVAAQLRSAAEFDPFEEA